MRVGSINRDASAKLFAVLLFIVFSSAELNGGDGTLHLKSTGGDITIDQK
ncbi:MAG: hypothetical protein AB1775_14975 [Bacteroidota bacterium]